VIDGDGTATATSRVEGRDLRARTASAGDKTRSEMAVWREISGRASARMRKRADHALRAGDAKAALTERTCLNETDLARLAARPTITASVVDRLDGDPCPVARSLRKTSAVSSRSRSGVPARVEHDICLAAPDGSWRTWPSSAAMCDRR